MSGEWGYMTMLRVFVWGYILGGLTLFPCALALLWFLGTKPAENASLDGARANNAEANEKFTKSGGATESKGEGNDHLGLGLDDDMLEKLKGRAHVPDAFAGYFAVCREYVPGGVNGKPPDRTTPAGTVVPVESPSVYQSMYRSIFDRNRVQSPTIESPNIRNKKARNVFYIVLRLGHLMLYDNEDQLEVRHVISLTHYKIDVYAGGDKIPEGELWIKRNCIRLIQTIESDSPVEAKTFYLFSDNCSEKEDLYHSMLNAQDHHKDHTNDDFFPLPLKFDTPDLVKLVQQLHASEENLHTRWINALIGRLFLALYKTSQLEDFITKKINKKIARVPKPAIISSVELRKVDMGTLPPFITNPKLKELTVDGDLVVEADVSYKGNFRVEISATVRIDLGARFKAREVTIILATVLNKLDGHFLIRIKPPPSNRLWISFETPPKMEMSLEPIVSSRQITYGVVLRAIESRIREVLNETLVLPNWDDMPFVDTIAQAIRGGIWEEDEKSKLEDIPKIKRDDKALESALADAERLDNNEDVLSPLPVTPGISIDSEDVDTGVSSSTDVKPSSAKPRTRRPSSSATPATLDLGSATGDAFSDRDSKTPTSIRSLPITSQMKSPLRFDRADSSTGSSGGSTEDVSTASLADSTKSAPLLEPGKGHGRTKSKELSLQEIAAAAAAAAGAANMPKKQTINQSISSATAAARNWLASKQSPQTAQKNGHQGGKDNPNSRDRSAEGLRSDGDGAADSTTPTPSKSQTEPMGRGQPLPPPGTPLPPPKTEKRQTWSMPSATTFANLAKRKSIAPVPALNLRKSQEQLASLHTPHSTESLQTETVGQDEQDSSSKNSQTAKGAPELPPRRKSSAASTASSSNPNPVKSPPPLPKRRQRQPSLNLASHNRRISHDMSNVDDAQESLLVIAAPEPGSSPPASPTDDGGRGGIALDHSHAESNRIEKSGDDDAKGVSDTGKESEHIVT